MQALTPAQRALVAEHIGLVGVHLRHHVPTPAQPNRRREYEDLFQEGCIALIRAAVTYDPRHDGVFPAYALPRIRGAVHAALHEYFATIRVPVCVARNLPNSGDANPRPSAKAVIELTRELGRTIAARTPPDSHAETIRHALRARYERAIRLALIQLGRRTWPRRNPLPIMERLAAERLLISHTAEQTPLRRIAREAGVSSGRASAYEHLLLDAVRERFASDPQVAVLTRWACEDGQGYDGALDARQRDRLIQAEVRAFEQRFSRLPRARQAELLYEMIERSAFDTAEVARNLYQLTVSDEPSQAFAVA